MYLLIFIDRLNHFLYFILQGILMTSMILNIYKEKQMLLGKNGVEYLTYRLSIPLQFKCQ